MIRSSAFGRPYGYAAPYGSYGYTEAELAAKDWLWTNAKWWIRSQAGDEGYFVDPSGWVYKVYWTDSMPLPDVQVVWSPKTQKEIAVKLDDNTAKEAAFQITENSFVYPIVGGKLSEAKAQAIQKAKTVSKASKQSGGGQKSPSGTPSPGTSLATSGGGRMTTSGGRRGGSGTPFYKNPWVIGGTAVAVLSIVAALVYRAKGKKP